MAKTDSEVIRDIVVKMIEKGMLVPLEDPDPETKNRKNIDQVISVIETLSSRLGAARSITMSWEEHPDAKIDP